MDSNHRCQWTQVHNALHFFHAKYSLSSSYRIHDTLVLVTHIQLLRLVYSALLALTTVWLGCQSNWLIVRGCFASNGSDAKDVNIGSVLVAHTFCQYCADVA